MSYLFYFRRFLSLSRPLSLSVSLLVYSSFLWPRSIRKRCWIVCHKKKNRGCVCIFARSVLNAMGPCHESTVCLAFLVLVAMFRIHLFFVWLIFYLLPFLLLLRSTHVVFLSYFLDIFLPYLFPALLVSPHSLVFIFFLFFFLRSTLPSPVSKVSPVLRCTAPGVDRRWEGGEGDKKKEQKYKIFSCSLPALRHPGTKVHLFSPHQEIYECLRQDYLARQRDSYTLTNRAF